MSDIPAIDVKKLRDRTGISFAKCKEALVKAGGDFEKAVDLLRIANKDAQDKFAAREAAEGRVAAFIDPARKVGALVEMRCETAPTAKNELFVALAKEVAEHVALNDPPDVPTLLNQPFAGDAAKTVNNRVGEVVGQIRENMKVARFKRMTGLLGSYIHHDGSVGVMVQVEGDKADPAVLRDVCMHITAKQPLAALREQIPQATIDKEMEIARTQAQEQGKGKPANIIEKIAEGKLRTWFGEKVLAEQPFVKDETKTVGDLLKSHGLKLVGFVRFKVGELS
jgi:elongation factor Ts